MVQSRGQWSGKTTRRFVKLPHANFPRRGTWNQSQCPMSFFSFFWGGEGCSSAHPPSIQSTPNLLVSRLPAPSFVWDERASRLCSLSSWCEYGKKKEKVLPVCTMCQCGVFVCLCVRLFSCVVGPRLPVSLGWRNEWLRGFLLKRQSATAAALDERGRRHGDTRSVWRFHFVAHVRSASVFLAALYLFKAAVAVRWLHISREGTQSQLSNVTHAYIQGWVCSI